MSYKEDDLVAEASELLGGNEEVQAAGVFGLAGLVGSAGVGALAGGVATGPGAALVGGDVARGAEVVSAVLGSIVAKRAYAESQGASLQLLVAVTDSVIHVLNRDHDHLPVELVRFDRATCEVTITKRGLSRRIHLVEPDSGEGLELTGAGGGFSPLAKGDKLVLALLSD